MIATAQLPLVRELKASYAFVERNVNLSKRYWGWELTYLLYTVAQSAAVIYIADAVPQDPKHPFDVSAFTLYLAIGALTWSYMANLFMAIAESVQWERWEGTIEYSMMAPISILTYILGSCLFGVLYGLIRTAVVLVLLVFMFHLSASGAGMVPALLIVGAGSLSFVGFGIMAATLPLLFTEKGAQMTYAIEACLLLVSGVYFPVSKLPLWLHPFSAISPATYVLQGCREALLGHFTGSTMVDTMVPLAVISVVTVPLGVWLFVWAEHFAKRTGRLKRTG
ncbi:MAG TPA: ABC transporter permease [Chloroflexota bacterium]|nr:ABC transporter permease [Chloroflexota bacterium]